MFGVFLFAKNLRLLGMYCAYPVLEYGILAILFVGIDISSYLRWEVPVPIEEGRNVSKTVKISDLIVRTLMFMFAFAWVVLNELISLSIGIQKRSLNRVRWVFLLLWNSIALGLVILRIVMLFYTIPW